MVYGRVSSQFLAGRLITESDMILTELERTFGPLGRSINDDQARGAGGGGGGGHHIAATHLACRKVACACLPIRISTVCVGTRQPVAVRACVHAGPAVRHRHRELLIDTRESCVRRPDRTGADPDRRSCRPVGARFCPVIRLSMLYCDDTWRYTEYPEVY
jgi:hypothetical protein